MRHSRQSIKFGLEISFGICKFIETLQSQLYEPLLDLAVSQKEIEKSPMIRRIYKDITGFKAVDYSSYIKNSIDKHFLLVQVLSKVQGMHTFIAVLKYFF